MLRQLGFVFLSSFRSANSHVLSDAQVRFSGSYLLWQQPGNLQSAAAKCVPIRTIEDFEEAEC
jgi:hypothetical protein